MEILPTLITAISIMVFIGVGIYLLGSAGDDLSCDDFTVSGTRSPHIASPTYVIPEWAAGHTGDRLGSNDYEEVELIYDEAFECQTCADAINAACGGTGQPSCASTLAADSPLRDLYSADYSIAGEWYDTCIRGQTSAQSGWGILVLIVIVIAAIAIISATRLLELW